MIMGVMCGGDNLCINMHTPYVAATSFFIHRTEIFDFVVRWDKKVYRRQGGECMKYDFINTSFGYVFLNCMKFLFWFFMNKALLVEIHILCAQKWAGGHTVPSRYGCVHEHLQLYKRNNYIYVNVIIYVYIRTHRWLYVVITTKVRYFLVRYFI